MGNDLDKLIEVQSDQNTIFGNEGDDHFILSGGINLIDGGEGVDTAVINLTQAEAGEISQNANVTNIGTDNTLLDVEFIEFSDVRLSVDAVVVPATACGDTDIEGDESVFVDLTALSGGTFADGSTTETAGLNILDNDSAIDVSILADDSTIIEGSPDIPSTFTLTLDRFGGLIGSDTIAVEIVSFGVGDTFTVDNTGSYNITIIPLAEI